LAEIACFGQPTQFEMGIEDPILSILWDFGDGNTSTDETPAHTYTATGNYTVSATVTTASGTSISTKDIIVNDMPVAYQPTDIVYCSMDGLAETNYSLSQKDAEILNGQDPNLYQVSYYATETDAENDTNPLSTSLVLDGTDKSLFARVYNVLKTECYAVVGFDVIAVPPPQIELEDRYVICPDAPVLVLDAGDFESYVWKNVNGAMVGSERIFNVQSLGVYTLTVTETKNEHRIGRFFGLCRSYHKRHRCWVFRIFN
jgi:PKD repeat protein